MADEPEGVRAHPADSGFVPRHAGTPTYASVETGAQAAEGRSADMGDVDTVGQADPAHSASTGSATTDGATTDGATTDDGVGANEEDEDFSFIKAFGGWGGVLDAGLPGAAFVLVYSLSGRQLNIALIVALGLAVALTIVRLVRKSPLQNVIGGLFGVGIAAFIAHRTGQAEDFYLPGLFINAAYGVGYLIANLIRWPLIGVLVGVVAGWGTSWRQDPLLVRAFQRVGWLWVGGFFLRILVQWPLWAAGQVEALGVARVAMGWPLWGVLIGLTYLMLKSWVPKQKWRQVKSATEQMRTRGPNV